MTPNPDSFEGMPEVLAEVAKAAGVQAAWDLAARLGGSRVHVAKRPRKGTLLVGAVGLEAARKIARLYGGETIPIPQGVGVDSARQRRAMLEMIEGGYSVEAICRKLAVDRRTVQRLKARMADRQQGKLFPRDSDAA